MRDLPERKFLRAVAGMGFDGTLQATADGLRFVSRRGLRVEPVLHPGTVRLDRRATLARMSRALKSNPAKSEATGAGTPMASVDRP